MVLGGVVERADLRMERKTHFRFEVAVVSGRVPASLLEAAKKRAHVKSDTELLKLALSLLAIEDDFGARLLRRKGALAQFADPLSG